MNRTSLLPRALLLAAALAAGGAAHAALDEAHATSDVHRQTWYFPDGSSHLVVLGADPAVTTGAFETSAIDTSGTGQPDTTVLGAGPASPADAQDEAAQGVTRTWFFQDGSSHTVRLDR